MDAMQSYDSDDEIAEVEDMFVESDTSRWRNRSTSSNSAIADNDYSSYSQNPPAHSGINACPRSGGTQGSHFPFQHPHQQHQHWPIYHYSTTSAQHPFTSAYSYNSTESAASAFTTTDPFYLAQVMASSHRAPPTSCFTHTSGGQTTLTPVLGTNDPRSFPFASSIVSAPASGASS